MKYPISTQAIIDVTKAPYFADNTGTVDCTDVLRQVFDDLLQREIDGVEQTYERLRKMSQNGTKNIYDGFENRDDYMGVNVIYPQYVPAARIIYFPAGIYLVSDTVTYSMSNLKNILYSNLRSELCRGIHIMGESRESVTIRLADYSAGFEENAQKPIISYINCDGFLEKECTNVAQCNTFEDITVDCGTGNPGAIGLLFQASNSGRIQNVSFSAQGSYCGIMTGFGTEVSINNVTCGGFSYGLVAPNTSICVLQDVIASDISISAVYSWNGVMVCNNVCHGKLPLITFEEGNGLYYIDDRSNAFLGELYGNNVYYDNVSVALNKMKIPENPVHKGIVDWAFVDDFGAVGDGKTDSTNAIQAAMNSGKSVVLFGEGHYLVSGEITIPATVRTVDFMFCDFFAADSLINAHGGALFHINEDSDNILFMENLYTFEQFYGYMRLIKHGAKRDLVMSDLHTQAASMYFNTVPGSKVYLDNCAATTGTYSCNAIIGRGELPPYYCHVIPYEFHGQTVYGKQVNPERANIEMLNDASDILIEGYKVEGPGTAVKTVNGGKTELHIVTCGIGYRNAPNAVFVTEYGDTRLIGARISGCDDKLDYNWIIEQNINGLVQFVHKDDIPDKVSEHSRIIHFYDSGELEKLR